MLQDVKTFVLIYANYLKNIALSVALDFMEYYEGPAPWL